MSKKSVQRDKSFFANPWNYLTLVIIAAGVLGLLFMPLPNGKRLYDMIFRPGAPLGRQLPPPAEIEAFYKDKAGALPVEPGFDADSGELCGNGKSYFWTSKPPKKPIPFGYSDPPRQGTDPGYQGPDPLAEFKESPYAMPSSKNILGREWIRDEGDDTVVDEIHLAAQKASGKIGVIGEKSRYEDFEALKDRLEALEQNLFEVDDDQQLAALLKSRGLDFVLIDRTRPYVAPWIEEKMSQVLLRLRDAVSLSWFHPVVLGSRFALYRITEPFEIPTHLKRRLSARARSLFLGEEANPALSNPNLAAVGDDSFRVIVSLRWRSEPRLKGRKVFKRMARGPSVVAALDGAVREIKKDWLAVRRGAKRDYGVEVPTDIPKAIGEMEIELDVLFDVCTLTDRTPANLLWYLELGLEGVAFTDGVNFNYLEGSYAVHMEINSEIRFFEAALRKAKLHQFLRKAKKAKLRKKYGTVLHESVWRRDRTHKFKRFRTLHWVETPGGGEIVELYRGVPLKTIWDVSRASLVRSLKLGSDWLTNNQSPDGQYAYKYTPTNKPGRRWTAGGNIVRHALNPYTLLMVNKIDPNPEYVRSAKKGIEFTLDFLRREGNRCVICHRDPPARYYNAKLGTVAVTILSILKLGDVADISEYDDVLRCLAEELLFMQDPNGHYWQYDVPPDHPYYGAESTIAPGEFVFALARMYVRYKDERYKESVDRALPFYMKAWRAREKNRTKRGIYDEEHRVNLIGIVPWLVTALNDLHKITGEQRYADIAFEQQDWIDNEFFWYLNRAQYPDYAGSAFKVHRELPAINSCQYIEGAAAAYDLAKRVNKNVEIRRQVVVHGMRFCLQVQFDSYGNTFFVPEPEAVMGGYRYTLGHLRLRNDYNYHAMAAIAQAVEYLEPSDYPAERPLRIPPVLRELLGGRPNPQRDVVQAERE